MCPIRFNASGFPFLAHFPDSVLFSSGPGSLIKKEVQQIPVNLFMVGFVQDFVAHMIVGNDRNVPETGFFHEGTAVVPTFFTTGAGIVFSGDEKDRHFRAYSLEKGVWLSPVRPYEYCRPIDEMPGEYRKKSS